ncbi:SDR family oxidoreductase [Viridibacillus sp. FSL R5-0477]|uniref:D-mannonate oxidoreductase n=1 Tax=Viridibacillus arenosi FSL R5-213 TaxID=1227360 RepID=W4F3S0_9BACL|nr:MULTISPECIES: SDR family oxidoreductase [Viridibacillus]ETT87473.1 D-mannonate oxidoreductase [Viridibacillus arenosi FSL R5-213]OMC82537.1 D-mannonate oxidoreductase [Viridibacillus sp. FSL H8-0123]OMC87721.1 D-mannonate oxidoreductase [Viridibacillus sp. FSL H7-0596]OMC91265.1 D-mannonate oxidoreductase [Viridibacillus arenosi]
MIPIHENLTGRVAVITGGSGVLCSRMAIELARHGMKIAILNRTAAKGQVIVDEIVSAGGTAISVVTDVLSRDELVLAKEQVLKQFGRIDLLINGAGGNDADAITSTEIYEEETEGKSFFDLKEEGFYKVFSSNFTGSFLASQVFGEVLLKSESPSIINISSMSAYSPMTKVPAYSAAKASINNFTQWMAVHFAEAGLRVNAIAPGFFLTKQNHNLLVNEEGGYTPRSKKILTATPMKRFGQPEDLLGTLLWLSDEAYSGFVTGITVPVDGGFIAYSGV